MDYFLNMIGLLIVTNNNPIHSHYYRLWLVTIHNYYGLLWITMDYYGFILITMDWLHWITMDYYGFLWIIPSPRKHKCQLVSSDARIWSPCRARPLGPPWRCTSWSCPDEKTARSGPTRAGLVPGLVCYIYIYDICMYLYIYISVYVYICRYVYIYTVYVSGKLTVRPWQSSGIGRFVSIKTRLFSGSVLIYQRVLYIYLSIYLSIHMYIYVYT